MTANSINIGLDSTSTGVATIASGGVLTLGSGYAFIANLAGSTGVLNINAGGTFTTSAAAQSTNYFLVIGGGSTATGASGTVNVTGAGALLDMNGSGATIGQTGTGTLAISAGGTAKFGTPSGGSSTTTGSLSIGRTGTGTVSVDGAGSALILSGGLFAGRASGSKGTISVTNGATLTETSVIASDGVGIGNSGLVNGTTMTGGTGTLTIASGGVATIANQIFVGTNGALGMASVTGAGSKLSAGDAVYVGGGSLTGFAAGAGTLAVSGGAQVVLTAAADTSKAYFQIGNSAASSGTVTVTGAGSLLDTGANGVTVGNGGIGSLTVSAGGMAKSSTTNSATRAALSVGSASGGSGTLTVSGSNSSYLAAGGAYFGRAGTGALVVDTGATFTGGVAATGTTSGSAVTIGSGDSSSANSTFYGGSGTAQVKSGASLHSLYNLNVGFDGTSGTLVVDAATASADRTIAIGSGFDRAGGVGTVTLQNGGVLRSGGQHLINNAAISIGNGAGNSGTVTVTGAGSLLDANGDRISIGTAPSAGSTVTGTGSGSLTVSAGGKVLSGASYADVEAALQVGAAANETGTLSITGAGSQLLASGLAVLGGYNSGSGLTAGGTGITSVTSGGRLNATGLAIFTGGSLTVDSTGTVDIGGTSGVAGAVTIEAGATLNARGGRIAGTLTGAGRVDMSGSLTVGNTTGGLTYVFSGAQRVLTFSSESGTSILSGFANADVLDFAGQPGGVSVSGNVLTAGSAHFTLTGQPNGTHYAIAADGNGGTAVTALSAVQDFNGDGRSDVLVQGDDGSVAVGITSGLSVSGIAGVASPGAAWHLIGSADFDGDGKADLLFQNIDGTLMTEVLNGTAVTAQGSLGNLGATWHARGIADFNNDGRADVLMQNTVDGSLALVATAAGGTSAAATVALGSFGASWHVEGVGDFDGDGLQEALFQNDDGRVGVVLQSNLAAGVQVLGNPGPGATIAGTGDYNGDGKTDALVHMADGTVLLGTISGAAVTGLATVGNPGSAYTSVVAGGDYNGDGKLDVAVQSTDSTVAAATLDGSANAVITAFAVLGQAGAGERVVGNVPTMFLDGTAAGTLAATPGADAFLVSAPAAGIHTITGFDPVLDRVVLSAATFGSYAAVQAAETSSAAGTMIALGGGASLLFQGIVPGQLHASNFAFV